MKHTPEQRKQNAILLQVTELQEENKALKATIAQLEVELWAMSEPFQDELDNEVIVDVEVDKELTENTDDNETSKTVVNDEEKVDQLIEMDQDVTEILKEEVLPDEVPADVIQAIAESFDEAPKVRTIPILKPVKPKKK